MHRLPPSRDLVLIGGGHAHALVLRMWGMDPLPGARLTVIDPGPVAPYTGMLPGHVAGHYGRCEMMIDLVRLARHAGARLILGRAEGIDRDAREVRVAGRPPVRYDVASIDIGITSDLPDLPGFAGAGVAVKPLGAYAARWEAFAAGEQAEPQVVILGAGVGGVELALATAHRLAARRPRVTLIDPAAAPLAGLGAGARAALLAHLDRAGITLLTGTRATAVEAEGVILSDGRRLDADLLLSAAGARPQVWLAGTGLGLTAGFVTVGETLQSSDPTIFAAGDCAHMAHAPRPKAGVFAVRQAPVLLHNPARRAVGRADARLPAAARLPQARLDRRARGGGRQMGPQARRALALALEGPDRPALHGPPVGPARDAGPALPRLRATGSAEAMGVKPLCGGCGAKVGAEVLSSALARLPAPQRPEVRSGPGDDAAILVSGAGVQVLTTDHLRAFTEDPWLMGKIAALHALGDIWAMGAAPQVALMQLTLPRMAPALMSATLDEITEAAARVFSQAGADIVGGHTTVGGELTVGFTVTGIASRVVAKGGARPGDALILTKPLGTGTILAAEMARARLPGGLLGESVAAAFASMTRPLAAASRLLAPEATAMTDVTGFGLAGHLLEMLDASGAAATIRLADLPLLPGAEALAAQGEASSIAPANRAVAVRMSFAEGPRAALLFDPQTAGGLLAAVPADRATALMAALADLGETAALIGHVTDGPPHLTAI